MNNYNGNAGNVERAKVRYAEAADLMFGYAKNPSEDLLERALKALRRADAMLDAARGIKPDPEAQEPKARKSARRATPGQRINTYLWV